LQKIRGRLNLGLRSQLLLSYLLIVVFTVTAVGLVASRLTERQFSIYVSETGRNEAGLLAAVFGDYFERHEGWDGVQDYVVALDRSPAQLMAYLFRAEDSPLQQLETITGQEMLTWGAQLLEQVPWQTVAWTLTRLVRGDQVILADANGLVIADSGREMLGERLAPAQLEMGRPVVVDGTTAGTVVVAAGLGVFNPQESAFLTRVNSGLLIIGLLSAGIALVVGWGLAHRVAAPARALTAAARDLADGNWDRQLSVRTNDEFGQMSAAFNEMAAEISRQSVLRRRLIADVAHELRTPLSVLRLEIEGAADGMQSAQEALAHAEAELVLLERLVQDLTLLARADAGEMTLDLEPEDLGAVVESTVERWRGAASTQDLQLTAQVEPDLPQITVDRVRITQVLTNLLSNALRHTAAGGRIEVKLRRQEEAAGVLVSVRDSGEGIPPVLVPHLFDRFYRVDTARSREKGGSGLGLSIARQVVESHGGTIWVESEVGHGSTFFFTLPLR
jgi:two-component system sensor histidine kinase BaeS